MTLLIISIVVASLLTGFLVGDFRAWREVREDLLDKDAALEVAQDAENYTKYCEQTKWRLKLAGTIEVIENDKVEVL